MSDDEEALSHLVSPEAAAALLGVSRATVLRWAAEGDLVGHRSGGHDWFARSQVLKLHAQRARKAAANRVDAARGRAAAGGDLDVPPTPAELIAAGRALRDGDPEAVAGVLARARRADARRSAGAL
jgi:excisionase family DNA binding protein